MRTTKLRLGVLALALATVAPLACSDVTDVELLQIATTGVVTGEVFLDLDGSGDRTAADEPIVAVDVVARTPTGEEVVRAGTDSVGLFAFLELPVGSYRIELDSAVLADSLEALGLLSSGVSVAPGDTTPVQLGATFSSLTLEEVLAGPPGLQVFTAGIALNPRPNDGDGQVHFTAGSSFLRALNVERALIAPGDSVRLRGRIVTDNGRAALDEVTPFILIQGAAVVSPEEVSTATAATADGGLLDAALVSIRDAEITDTSRTADGDFRFWADDGTDSVEVVVREFLGLDSEAFRPDTIVRIDRMTGLLSPFDGGAGQVRWRLLPRGGSDIALELREADVSVSIALDTTQASLGDTVEVRVVAANAGPLVGSMVEVRDTVPSALTYVSSTTTVGSYDSGSGIWDLGDMSVGQSDTLWVRMEVTDGAPAQVLNVAESLGPLFEIDPPSTNNNVATVILNIS